MSNFLKTTIFCTLVIIACFAMSHSAQAAILSITPNYKDVSYGETFVVDVRFNGEREIINAIQATISYSSNLLKVVDVSTGGSFLTLWAQEPIVDHQSGTITLAGGIPHGSYVVDGRVVQIIFETKSSGSTEIDFSSSGTSVHLNDQYGTAVETELIPGVFHIFHSVLTKITSPTHPEEDTWYSNNNPIVRWEASIGSLYSYTLANDPDEVPDTRVDQTTGEVAYLDLNDGIYYFILNERQPEGDWAVAGRRRVNIDTKTPVAFKAIVGQDNTIFGGQKFLTFSTTDLTSGISHYDVVEGLRTYREVTSPYQLKDQSLDSRIIVRAYDKAGNQTASSLNSDGSKTSSGVIVILIVIAGLAFILFVIIFMLLLLKMRRQKSNQD